MDEQRIQLLQSMPVFGGIREDTLNFLLGEAHVVCRGAGEFYFRQGDQAGAMFVLESGRVAVLKSWEDKEYQLKQYGPGDCFGEMALIDLFPRDASIKALEPCNAIEISNASLFQLYARDLEQFAMIQMNMGREISRRLRTLEEYVFRGNPGVPWPEVRIADGG